MTKERARASREAEALIHKIHHAWIDSGDQYVEQAIRSAVIAAIELAADVADHWERDLAAWERQHIGSAIRLLLSA